MEHPSRAVGRAVLIKKGQIIPENAEPMSDKDIIEIQERRIEKFKPQSEMRVFTWGAGSVGASVAMSSLIINGIFRQNFKLGGLRRMGTYIPVVCVPTLASLFVHDVVIKKRLLLGQETCPLCFSFRSALVQVGCGIIYPYVISVLACIPVARQHYTLPLPVQRSPGVVSSYLRLLRQVSPSSMILMGLTLGHMLIGMKLAHSEMKVFHRHLSGQPTDADLLAGMKYGRR